MDKRNTKQKGEKMSDNLKELEQEVVILEKKAVKKAEKDVEYAKNSVKNAAKRAGSVTKEKIEKHKFMQAVFKAMADDQRIRPDYGIDFSVELLAQFKSEYKEYDKIPVQSFVDCMRFSVKFNKQQEGENNSQGGRTCTDSLSNYRT